MALQIIGRTGDAGGPLLINGLIAGLVSGGTTANSTFRDVAWWTGTFDANVRLFILAATGGAATFVDLADIDGDSVPDNQDNCPNDPNPLQENFDGDAEGDACDPDDDNDGQTDADEVSCGSDPMNAASLGADNDSDNLPDCVDPDDDNDGVDDDNDAFPFDPTESSDNDGDGTGDNADVDDDNDGQTDADEVSCGSDPLDAASISTDGDGDNVPDCVDPDDDGDGVDDNDDHCPATIIPEAVPTSNRGLGRNRWTLDNPDGTFTQGPPQSGRMFSFSTSDTGGCTCEQIIAELGLGKGHQKYGCSTGVMLNWVNAQ